MNPPLSDVCIATSAAPCSLPPYKFTTTKVFNLVDGGVAANNPVSCYNPIKTSICVELDMLVQNPMSFRSMKEKLIYDFLFSGLNMVSINLKYLIITTPSLFSQCDNITSLC
jgi:patatin-like phospholipase/acyl hydrolase